MTTDQHEAGTATTVRSKPHPVAGTSRRSSRRAFVRQLGTTLGVGLGVALLPGQAAANRKQSTLDCDILCSPYKCTNTGCCRNAHIFYCRCSPFARYICLPGFTCTSFCTHSCPTGQC
ncbi:MAG TPA: hypothetical protein VG276_27175 [Actinomycetes bacterium]|nr:hypothetical protein [Actinomycetes bacterium]